MRRKRKAGVPKGYKPKADPTPAQIKAACLKIQSTWTPAERLKRAVYHEQPEAETPTVAVGDVAAAL